MNQIEYKPLEGIRSSYKKNNIGETLYRITLAKKAPLIVECGVLDGYSLFHFAKATKKNSEAKYFDGHVVAFDLFEKYEYNHGNAIDVYNMLKHEGVADYVTILQGDAFEVYNKFEDGELQMLHMDISNDGNTYLKTVELWGPKMERNGLIILEGGSSSRDRVSWMVDYRKRPIREVLPIIAATRKWQVSVLEPFPSLTILRKL